MSSEPTAKTAKIMPIPAVTLSSGASMPLLGLGTWKSKPGQVEDAVKYALSIGYRHIDCAFAYGNEAEVGAALKAGMETGIKREEIFLTSKLWNTKHNPADVKPALEKTLSDLGVSYLDLFLIHWPICFKSGGENFPKDEQGNLLYEYVPLVDTWKAMEELVDAGLVKAIGVSNFNSKQIQKILDNSRIKPAVLQVESNLYFNNKQLIDFCQEKGIVVTAYSPLGSPDRPWARPDEPALLQDPKLEAIANKYGKTPAQICIKYQAQRNVVVIPKSVTSERIKLNMEIFDFELSPEDMKILESFNVNFRACAPTVERDGKRVFRDGHHQEFPFHEAF